VNYSAPTIHAGSAVSAGLDSAVPLLLGGDDMSYLDRRSSRALRRDDDWLSSQFQSSTGTVVHPRHSMKPRRRCIPVRLRGLRCSLMDGA